jgi:hypothetical protein
VAELARSGADFDTLIREHSDSDDADRGGVVGNVPPTALDDTTAAVLGSLSEGEVSPVVETRTGLHIFRLDRVTETEPLSEERIVSTARTALRRRQLQQERITLLAELRDRIPVTTDESDWTIGSWHVDSSVMGFVRAPVGATDEALRVHVVDQFLLAQEALDRGLAAPEIDDEVERILSSTVLDRCRSEVRDGLVAELSEIELRELYDAQPSHFNEQEKAHVELIFIPQGKDGFRTQRMVEELVAQLKVGASFAEAARRQSVGPGAEDGGDLGILERSQWAAFGPTVFKALREIKVGQVSNPIYCSDKVMGTSSLLRGGFAVVRINQRIPERPRSFEEAIDDVRQAWAMRNRDLMERRIVDRILDDGGFEIVRLPSPDELGM